MKKKTVMSIVTVAGAAFLLSAGVLSYLSKENGAQTSAGLYEQDGTEENKTKETEESNAQAGDEPEIEITKQDIARLEAQLAVVLSANERLKKEAALYETSSHELSQEELEELVQSEILQCYEENTLLAVEIKTVVLESLGVEIPDSFPNEDVMDDYVQFVKDTVTEGVLSQIASEDVQELLKYGVEGAVDAYKSAGTLQAAIEGAAASAIDGVCAKLQDAPMEISLSILDETTGGLASLSLGLLQSDSPEEFLENLADEKTGGLLGTISEIVNYDTSSAAMLENLSDSASSSASEMKTFIGKETVNSQDIASLMYAYAQFGNTLDTFGMYGGEVSFDWESSYQNMEVLYERFVRNEIMIAMLNQRGAVSVAETERAGAADAKTGDAPETEKSTRETAEERTQSAERDASKDGAPETGQNAAEGGNSDRYRELLDRIDAAKAQAKELQAAIDSGRELLAPLEEYRSQVEDCKTACAPILNYRVENFEMKFNGDGSDWVQENNKLARAAAEITRYTPWGFAANLFATMAIDNSDSYYDTMVDINETYSEAYGQTSVDAANALEELDARIEFYRGLVQETDDPKQQFRNYYLLSYIQGDEPIDMDAYRMEAAKKLYLLAAKTDVTEKLYHTVKIYDTDAFAVQYEEIMNIVRGVGEEEVKAQISAEELADCLVPMLDAGIYAIDRIAGISQWMEGCDTGFFQVWSNYVPGDTNWKVEYCIVDGSVIRHNAGVWMYYFSSGEPFYVGEYYIYDGKILNGADDMDGAAVCEEAVWMRGLVVNNEALFPEIYEHYGRLIDALND